MPEPGPRADPEGEDRRRADQDPRAGAAHRQGPGRPDRGQGQGRRWRSDRTKAETEKLVAEVEAEGEKKAREIEADDREAQGRDRRQDRDRSRRRSTKVLGEANAKTIELTNQAEADRFRQYVKALGGPDAYNRYVFAEGLPADLRLGVFYAGPGTFWTDLKGFEQAMLGKLASETTAGPRTTTNGTIAMPVGGGPR